MKYYVYAHMTELPRDKGDMFYIGKGFGKRAWNKQKRSVYWHNIVQKYGHRVEILVSRLTEDQAFELEKSLIRIAGRDSLCNLTDGGEGSSGIVFTDEWKAKLVAARTGSKRSAETKARMSAAQLGHACSEKARLNLSLSHQGKVMPEEQKRKISETLKGRPKTEDHKRNSGAGNRGKKRTDEWRKAKSEEVKAHWAAMARAAGSVR